MSAAVPRAPWLRVLAFALALLLPALAAAQTNKTNQDATARAKALFDRAEVHFSLHEFDKALALYGAAYRLKQMPEFLFNMGQCNRYLGNHERAIFHYKQFMLKKPSSPQRAQVEQLVAESEQALRAERAARAQASADAQAKARACVSRGWFWAGVGVTSALTVTSITSGVLASGADDSRGLEITSWTTLGGAVVAAASTVGLYWLSRPVAPKRVGARIGARVGGRVALVPLLAQRSGGVLLMGRF